MAQSQTHQNLYKILDAINRLSGYSAGRYIASIEIAQELNLDHQDVLDYLDILKAEEKVYITKTPQGGIAALTSIGRLSLKDPEYSPTNIGSNKISAEIGESPSNVIVGQDITQHITNNYTRSSSLDGVPLSEEEKELLVAASQNEGEIFMINTQQVDFIRIRRNYIKDEEPSSAAPYREALEDLVERGYVKHDRGVLYKLTSAGRRQARSLGSKE